MTVAVTGGTGFVGRTLLDVLAEKKIPAKALTRRDVEPRDGVEWVHGTLSDEAALARLVAGCDAVIHLAGVVNAPDAIGFETGNVEGTRAMVEATRDAGIRRFVFVSSLAAREPELSNYGGSKKRAENLVTNSTLDWTVVRPPAVYGPRDTEMFEMFRAAGYGVVPVPPRGRTSLIHVRDLARLLVALIPATPAASRKVYEPDDGRTGGMTHRELGKAMGRAMGRNVRVVPLPGLLLRGAARADMFVRRGRAKLTSDRVGYMTHPDWAVSAERRVPPSIWVPEIDAEEGLLETARWYRKEGWLQTR